MEAFTELPPDIFVIQTTRNCVLPDGLSIVDLAPLKEIPLAIEIPNGLELVQIQLAVMLPPGVMISPDIEIIPPPRSMPTLPHVGFLIYVINFK